MDAGADMAGVVDGMAMPVAHRKHKLDGAIGIANGGNGMVRIAKVTVSLSLQVGPSKDDT